MENDKIIYQPYRIGKIIIFFLQMVLIFLIIMLGIAIKQNSFDGIVVIGILLSLIIVLIKLLYDSIKIKVIFDKEYIRLFNGGKQKQYDIPWKEISNGYYCKDWHGNLYLVLSSKSIEPKKVKKLVNKYTNSLNSNIYIDDCILIVIGTKNQKEQIEKVMYNKKLVPKKV